MTRRQMLASVSGTLALSAAPLGARAESSRAGDSPSAASPDPYNLLVIGGRVIDSAQNLDAVRDVAIRGGKIAAVEHRFRRQDSHGPPKTCTGRDGARRQGIPRLNQGLTPRRQDAKDAKKTRAEILALLKSMGSPEDRAGMARFGITVDHAYGGVSTPALKKLAREIGKDHRLAQELWKSGIHEARHLAALIDEPAKVTERQMELWAREFDSWDIVDGCCLNLLVRTPYAQAKAVEWSRREEEYVKRAAFSLMAVLAVHDKSAADGKFLAFLPIIKRESLDERNFVKKAVNWALRQIGKRNPSLNKAAVKAAREIRQIDSRSARWIAADALRELTGDAVQRRLGSPR